MVLDKEVVKRKSATKLSINIRLIGVTFVIFTFIIAIKPQIFIAKKILALELIMAIPFLLTAALSFSKLAYAPHSKEWDWLSWACFLVGYTFLLNVVGIIVAIFISVPMAILFFVVNWVLSIVYSYADVYPNTVLMRKDVFKNLVFIGLQLILGVLPAIGVI